MGVCYDAMTYAGEYFNTERDAAEMLVEQGVLVLESDESIEDIDSDWIRELSGLDVQCENYFTGKGYYVGFEAGDWKGYQKLLDEYKRITGRDGDIHDFCTGELTEVSK